MLYGKWRPQNFDEVVGQDQIVTTLKNALTTGQIAHAYLFSGPRGTGKTTMARILARAINCSNLQDGQPCNACAACVAIGNGTALDLIEMDAASNRGIDEIRDLREKIAYAPSDLKAKVYLLDEVHMLTKGAFNALLKTLEEPPPHAFFILATTELHDVPATVVSRCQRYDFRRVPLDAIVGRLALISREEGFSIPDDALQVIAKQARGGLRDAITLLEQVASQYGNAPTREDVLAALGLVHDERIAVMADAILDEDLGTALTIAREVADDGIGGFPGDGLVGGTAAVADDPAGGLHADEDVVGRTDGFVRDGVGFPQRHRHRPPFQIRHFHVVTSTGLNNVSGRSRRG